MLGDSLGDVEGLADGLLLGLIDGLALGDCDGELLGLALGLALGLTVGASTLHVPYGPAAGSQLAGSALQVRVPAHPSSTQHCLLVSHAGHWLAGAPQSTSVSSPSCVPLVQPAPVGDFDGLDDGLDVGLIDGDALGDADGLELGLALGDVLGDADGLTVGDVVSPVGLGVGKMQVTSTTLPAARALGTTPRVQATAGEPPTLGHCTLTSTGNVGSSTPKYAS